MKIWVDFFKPSGKWYLGGEVEMGDARLHMGEPYRQAIVDNQRIMMDGWQHKAYYYVVTRDLAKYDEDPHYTDFNIALFTPDEFIGLKRKKEGAKNGRFGK